MDDALQQTWNTVATFVPKLVAFLVILIVGWIIAKVLAKAVNARCWSGSASIARWSAAG
jgi:hypothetical protein